MAFRNGWESLYNQERDERPVLTIIMLCLAVAIGSLYRSASEITGQSYTISSGLCQQTWSLLHLPVARPSLDSLQVILLHVGSRLYSSCLVLIKKVVLLMHQGKGGLAWVVCGLAIRFAQSLGLHRRTPRDFDLTSEQINLRGQLWWAVFSLDAYVPHDWRFILITLVTERFLSARAALRRYVTSLTTLKH